MDLWTILGAVLAGAVGYVIRHRQGDPTTPPTTPTQSGAPAQPSPATPPSVVPGLPASLSPALQAITQRPAFSMLLSALAHQAASTPTLIDDMLVQIAQSITGTAPNPQVPAPVVPATK